MEFYASWCPACKHFQTHYEKVSAFFYGSPRPKPEVYVARVDCATEVRKSPPHLPHHPPHPRVYSIMPLLATPLGSTCCDCCNEHCWNLL